MDPWCQAGFKKTQFFGANNQPHVCEITFLFYYHHLYLNFGLSHCFKCQLVFLHLLKPLVPPLPLKPPDPVSSWMSSQRMVYLT